MFTFFSKLPNAPQLVVNALIPPSVFSSPAAPAGLATTAAVPVGSGRFLSKQRSICQLTLKLVCFANDRIVSATHSKSMIVFFWNSRMSWNLKGDRTNMFIRWNVALDQVNNFLVIIFRFHIKWKKKGKQKLDYFLLDNWRRFGTKLWFLKHPFLSPKSSFYHCWHFNRHFSWLWVELVQPHYVWLVEATRPDHKIRILQHWAEPDNFRASPFCPTSSYYAWIQNYRARGTWSRHGLPF